MSDLIGRLLSFEEHMGRGLVKFAYYCGLFFLACWILHNLWAYLVVKETRDLGLFLIQPFLLVFFVVLLRVASELAMAILSIDDNLQASGYGVPEGFEAGLTPLPTSIPPTTVTPGPAKKEDAQSAKRPAKKNARKSTKRASKKAAKRATPVDNAPPADQDTKENASPNAPADDGSTSSAIPEAEPRAPEPKTAQG